MINSRTLVLSIIHNTNNTYGIGLFPAACGKFPPLLRPTTADYGVRYAVNRRGAAGIQGYLEKGVQRGDLARGCAELRHAAHRALRPACQASAVGEEVVCTIL